MFIHFIKHFHEPLHYTLRYIIFVFGILWLVTLMVQVKQGGLIAENRRRLMCLSMFWHFLDVIWIGVFTFVYLMGTLP